MDNFRKSLDQIFNEEVGNDKLQSMMKQTKEKHSPKIILKPIEIEKPQNTKLTKF